MNSDNAEAAFSHGQTSHPICPDLPVRHSAYGGGVGIAQGPGHLLQLVGARQVGGGVRHQAPGRADLPAPEGPLGPSGM